MRSRSASSAGSVERAAAQVEQRQGRRRRRAGRCPAVLPVCAACGDEVDHVVDRAGRRRPICSPNSATRLAGTPPARARTIDAHSRRGGDERAGLVGEHLEVVLDRVLALAAARWSRAAGRGTSRSNVSGLQLEPRARPVAAISLLARAKSRSPVRIATELPQTVCALGTPRRMLRLVHDVVVVERGEVGDLDRLGGRDHLGLCARRRAGRSAASAAGGPACRRRRAGSGWSRRRCRRSNDDLAAAGPLDLARGRPRCASANSRSSLGREQALGEAESARESDLLGGPTGRRRGAHSLARDARPRGLHPRCSATMPPVRLR